MSDMDSKRDYNPVSPGVSFNVQIRRDEITKMIKKITLMNIQITFAKETMSYNLCMTLKL